MEISLFLSLYPKYSSVPGGGKFVFSSFVFCFSVLFILFIYLFFPSNKTFLSKKKNVSYLPQEFKLILNLHLIKIL
jgi:hypothetical protein